MYRKMIERKLYLLMWKNYRIRRYHWFTALLEIFIPILMVYIGVKLYPITSHSTKRSDYNENIGPVSDQSMLFASIPLNILYTPSSKFTDNLMKKELKNVINGLSHKKNNTSIIKVKSVRNETDLEVLISDKSNNLYSTGIVFLNVPVPTSNKSEEKIPKELSYKIRKADFVFTSLMYDDKKMDVIGHVNNDNSYFSKGLAGLQLAIDMSYIRAISANKKIPSVKVQRFPYRKYSSDSVRNSVITYIYWTIIFTLMIISLPIIRTIIDEKESGVKELLKTCGIDEWLITFGWFLNATSLSLISFTIVTVMIVRPFDETAVIHLVNPIIFWAWITLYCVANFALCLVFCAIFHQSAIGTSIYLIIYSLVVICVHNVDELDTKISILSYFFPAVPFYEGFRKIRFIEVYELKVASMSMYFEFGMLILDTIWLLLLSHYINCVNPGKLGAKKSYLFFLQPLLEFKKRAFTHHQYKNKDMIFDENDSNMEDNKYFEKAHSDLAVSIDISNLYKKFNSRFALKGVNLKFYKGEITALLGPNGAGKTTTIAILTGMTTPSKGSVYVDGINIIRNISEFRNNLGICPQENLLFPYLTVMDHLLFFGMLRGMTKVDAKTEAIQYLGLMDMYAKEGELPTNLSGGMKRKLCLSISLMGNPQVVILDEPTSGIDVQSRRKLWDLLKSEKKNRTVILSTHHMEEAEALSDRIAIIHEGNVVCYGTSMFLKKNSGCGYQLIVTKKVADVSRLNFLVTNSISNSTVEYESESEVVYNLPLTESHNFGNLFQKLESNRSFVDIISSMSVSSPTVEQVFLKMGGVRTYNTVKNSSKNNNFNKRNTENFIRVTGFRLIIQQLAALIKKKWLYSFRNLYHFIMRIVFPTLFLLLLWLAFTTTVKSLTSYSLTLKNHPNSQIMLQNSSDAYNMNGIFKSYVKEFNGKVIYSQDESIVKGLLLYHYQDFLSLQKILPFAADFSYDYKLLLYNQRVRHSLPVAINTYTNVILRMFTNSSENSIETSISHPIKLNDNKTADKIFRSVADIFLFVLLIYVSLGFYSIDITSYYSRFLNIERLDGFRHIQLMSHVSATMYWLSNFIFDYCLYIFVIVIRIVLFKWISYHHYFGLMLSIYRKEFATLSLLILLFGVSGLLFVYVINHTSSSKSDSHMLMIMLNIIGIFVSFGYILFESAITYVTISSSLLLKYYFMNFLILLIPPLNFSIALIKFLLSWGFNNFICTGKIDLKIKEIPCPVNQEYLVYASKNNPFGILLHIQLMICSSIFYTIILSLISKGYFNNLENYLLNQICCNRRLNYCPHSQAADHDVIKEREEIRNLIRDKKALLRDTALVSYGLNKTYWKMSKWTYMQNWLPRNWFYSVKAVLDVSFIVKSGQCFGLLGLNGAGKSTTFKMLTTATVPSKGNAWISGVNMIKNRTKYLSEAGYCAQTNCFIEEFTGQEMLWLIATLRGVPKKNRNQVVNKWLSIVGLENHRNHRCSFYSGGNKRRLCTAMSMIGNPQVVFLDEPTTGVDPISRHKLYDIMEESKCTGQAVVLSSHSMEECENLCDSLTIIAKGVMKCIGTVQHLKKLYSQGFSIMIKVKELPDERILLNELKTDMTAKFDKNNYVLKDEHKGLLYYQINNVKLKWSILFKNMEELKLKHKIIEDYTISDDSLEEIFLSFTK